MEYLPRSRFEPAVALKKNKVENPFQWRCLHFDFKDLPDDMDKEKLATKIFKIFESLEGEFYFDPRHRMTAFCKMGEKILIDDIAYKVKSLIKHEFECRIGEQIIILNGIVSLQFLFAPAGAVKQQLSQEFIVQERMARQNDIIMVVEDDMFSRNVAKNALHTKFKIVEVTDGGKATQEYMACSPDVVFLDIHLPNKKGYKILQEIMEVDPQAYIVMVSADTAEKQIRQCIDLGAKGFIAKPFRGEKLFDYIRKCPTIRVYC
jgi:two-component system chemotaxis response regulator CheY